MIHDIVRHTNIYIRKNNLYIFKHEVEIATILHVIQIMAHFVALFLVVIKLKHFDLI